MKNICFPFAATGFALYLRWQLSAPKKECEIMWCKALNVTEVGIIFEKGTSFGGRWSNFVFLTNSTSSVSV